MQVSRMLVTQETSSGRCPGPDSPPAMTQSRPFSRRPSSGPIKGSRTGTARLPAPSGGHRPIERVVAFDRHAHPEILPTAGRDDPAAHNDKRTLISQRPRGNLPRWSVPARPPVDPRDLAAVEGGTGHQLKLGWLSYLGEQGPAAARHEREHAQPVLIDQVVAGQLLCEAGRRERGSRRRPAA